MGNMYALLLVNPGLISNWKLATHVAHLRSGQLNLAKLECTRGLNGAQFYLIYLYFYNFYTFVYQNGRA